MPWSSPRSLMAIAILAILFLAAAGPSFAAKDNLLENGDFSRGSGNSVDEWRNDAWILTAGTTDYRWIRPKNGQPGEIVVATHLDNDARWVQQLSLGPGWYYISAEVRTVGVLPTLPAPMSLFSKMASRPPISRVIAIGKSSAST